MEKIRQVLRCYSQSHGTRSISSMLSISRNTVKKYLQVFQQSGPDYEQILSLSDQELSVMFHEKTKVKTGNERMEELKSLLPEYCKRLQKKGVTREALHREYLSSYPGGFGRTRFYILIQQHIACSRPIMHLEHKASDKMFIDFAGDKLSIIDITTGEIIPVEVFVAIHPCSQLTYVEAVMSQKKEDLVRISENALLYYQGSLRAIVPDNLKKIERLDILILDDFGIQPFDSQGRMSLMDIIEDRHCKKSTIITSQIPVKDWYDVIGEKTIADAVLGRIVHQAIRVEFFGESLRKSRSKKESLYL